MESVAVSETGLDITPGSNARALDGRAAPGADIRSWLLAGLLALVPLAAWGQPVPGSLDVRWNPGATDCAADPQPPLQVHAYEPQTRVIRQSPCASFEANFLYLLIGTERALLIDTGAIESSVDMPLAETVLALLPDTVAGRLPLLIGRTHGHRDHRNGDVQFAALPDTTIVPVEAGPLREFFGFGDWPGGAARLDLGDRVIHVLPAPGHHPNHLVFYDERTALLFTGDFLLPGRLVVDDIAAYRQSARRIVEFLADRPVAHVLGGHIELDAGGRPYARGARFHPDEHPLQLSAEDLRALPAALDGFNGFYSRHPNYIVIHPLRILMVAAAAALLALGGAGWLAFRWARRRRSRNFGPASPQSRHRAG